MREYYVYYSDKENDNYVVYDAKEKQIKTMEHEEWYKLERKYPMLNVNRQWIVSQMLLDLYKIKSAHLETVVFNAHIGNT